MASKEELARKRDATSVVITRVAGGCEAMRGASVDILDVSEIEGQLESVENAAEEFLSNHDALTFLDEALARDQEHKDVLSTHQDLLHNTRRVLTGLLNRAKAAILIRQVEVMMADLEESIADGGYEPTMQDDIEAAGKVIAAIRTARSLAGARVCGEITDLAGRVNARFRKLRVHLEKPATIKVEGAPTVVHQPQGLSLEIPKFNGTYLEWEEWWETFSTVMKEHSYLTLHSQKCHLIKSMGTDECKEYVKSVFVQEPTYERAIVVIREKYENARSLHLHHYKTYYTNVQLTNKVKDMRAFVNKGRATLKAFKKNKAETLEQNMAMHAIVNLSPHLLEQWKKSSKKSKVTPPLEEVLTFLEDQIANQGAEEISSTTTEASGSNPSKFRRGKKEPARTVLQTPSETTQCPLCKGAHFLHSCSQYHGKTAPQRNEFVREARLCFNCLSNTHRLSACRSERKCKTCGRRHHTTIHLSKPVAATEQPVETVNLVDGRASNKSKPPQPLTSTAIATIRAEGLQQRGRVQFDTAAMVSFITTKMATTLRAQKIPHSGMGFNCMTTPGYSKHKVQVTVVGSKGETVTVLAQVIDVIPPSATNLDLHQIRALPFLSGLRLADPEYTSMARVDLLLDVETGNACYLGESRIGEAHGLKADLTMFGWMLYGGETVVRIDPPQGITCLQVSALPDPVQIFQDLLTLEEDAHDPLTHNEQLAVQHFQDNVKRDEEGRYHVSLPRKVPTPALGRSKEGAVRRYLNGEKSLKKQGNWEKFSEAVDDYLDQDHSEPVPEEELQKPVGEAYYLPLHGVTKESSSTTKLRIVFDASARTTNGTSLNDTLLPGPSLHPALPSVLTSFRGYAVAITADVSRMFREIGLNYEEYDYHRYVHRRPDGVLQEMRSKRLTFGIKSSPFIANQVLRQISTDYRSKYPLAAVLVEKNFYVDDCLAGADTVEEAFEKVTELLHMTKEGCMELKKWRSNSSELLALIPDRLKESSDLVIPSTPASCSKALGLHWSVRDDCLYVAVPEIAEDVVATRRTVASSIAKVFDVLGFFSPAILPARVILQQTWDLQQGWDDELPETMQTQWKMWVKELHNIANCPIPRYLGTQGKEVVSVQLHGFSDASLTAYGGVVYTRTFHKDLTVSIGFVASRTRVVPRKKPSVPRLELCGALILAQLLKRVQEELIVPPESVFGWTDSTVVLGWLRRSPGDLMVFACNRVKKICEIMDPRHWRHVSGDVNPADLLSRGEPAGELATNEKWWKGPPWLREEPEDWPRGKPGDEELPELKRTVLQIQVVPEEFGEGCSSLDRLCRVLAWMRRFCHREPDRPPYITVPEYRAAKLQLLRYSQRCAYNVECSLLENGKCLPDGNPLASLSPYLDSNGVLRVGGRLQKAGLTDAATHPMILSVRSHIVTLLIESTHRTLKHAGPSTVMATMAYQYHVPRIKRTLRKLGRECVICRKAYARTTNQMMGELPPARTQVARPFTTVGMDFAGPFPIKRGRTRRPDLLKAYICVFVCFSTRAVHLELVSDMTTPAFLAALSRFVSRRGCPLRIETDNGSNFVGAEAELRRATEHLRTSEHKEQAEYWATQRNVEWKFTPARSPHRGGLWEAAVGAMKRVLRKVLTNATLRFEDLTTVIAEAEAVLNSRPLVPKDTPADDAVEPLTPGHFLIGAPLAALPFQPDTQTKLSLLKRWNLVQRLQYEIWRQWKTEYLPTLQPRHQWKRPNLEFKVGDVVMMKDVDSFQRVWPTGRITAVYPGPDGLVRTADVLSRGKTWRRTTHKLVHLCSEYEGDTLRGENVRAEEEVLGGAEGGDSK